MLSEFKERLKIIFYKSTFDFDSPDITLARYHPQMYYLLAMNGIFFNDSKSLVRFLWPAICVSLSFVAMALEGMVVVHALMVGDTALFTEAFAYTLIMGVVPVLFYCTLRKDANIRVFLGVMDEDFKKINVVGEPYRSLFMAKQLNIWQCGCSWLLFILFVFSCYILLSASAVVFYCLFSTHNEDTRRPLIFPLWLPYDDPQLSPLYEIFMFLEYLAICDFVSCFTTYVYILFHLLLRSYFTLDLVMLGIERLFDDVDGSTLHERYDEVKGILQARIKRIVSWHNSVFDNVTSVVDIYGPVLAYQVVLSSLVICLITLYISIQLKEGAVDILVSLLAVGSLLQLWIPCYIGSLMSIKGMQVADCCFYSGWYTHNARLVGIVLPDILMIMMRAQRPIVIQVAALPSLQLETFSSILSTAYTYFNMLSQKG